MSSDQKKPACSGADCGCRPAISRRNFVGTIGLGAAALAAAPIMAGPFQLADFEKLVPADKKLSPEWIKSLTARGSRTIYRGAELEKIGMPIGGICTGQLYLGGDGRLWRWDIFNEHRGTGDSHYAHPPLPDFPVQQGFALRITTGGKTTTRRLDRTGFSDISFIGEYPIGYVEYRDPASPLAVSLEAFSPFIPLNADDSHLPATVMQFTVKNTGSDKVTAELAGWLQNAVCLNSGKTAPGTRRNAVVRQPNLLVLECTAGAAKPATTDHARADVVFEDFQKETYEGWKVTGTAFGRGPILKSQIPDYQGDVGCPGKRVVNSHATATGGDVAAKDNDVGTLVSKPFTIERDFITFWIGGGNRPGKTGMHLVIDGKTVRAATGHDNNRMRRDTFDVKEFAGKTAHLEILDNATGGWGNIGIAQIVFSDKPAEPALPLHEQADFGTMALGLLDAVAGDRGWAAIAPLDKFPEPAKLPADTPPENAESPMGPSGAPLIGCLGRTLTLDPGQQSTVTFVVAWYFPNVRHLGLPETGGRKYGKRFISARAVVEYQQANHGRLTKETRLWHDTWYDSSLPYWFLDRTLLNISVLATSTAFWFANNRFYGWEGVGCCPGTCTHVWHYAQAMGRLFPSIERTNREIVDYGLSFHPDSGVISFRGEFDRGLAVDGQAGTILRAYREHQMSADNAFLKRNWPKIKRSIECLIEHDPNRDGMLDGPQMNTLDAAWFGDIAWLSSLYVAALRAGEQMAREMDDTKFAQQAGKLAELGSRNIDQKVFNGEYYYQIADPKRPKSVGSFEGCEIDQVFGQSWAFQVGLPRVLPEEHTKKALQSLWRYNFTPDVGPYRNAYKAGRWYAMAGEAGLLMCSWPKGEAARLREAFDFYFNECMTGFEYQVAGHMVWEGMLQEGLAITRAIHDRYHASRRNPWNEVECGDHYARAMASYGVFLATCGYEYHGPQGRLAFAPRLTSDKFRAAFTTAEGWGSYSQERSEKGLQAKIELKWGQLRLAELALAIPEGVTAEKLTVSIDGKPLATLPQTTVKANQATLRFADAITLKAGQVLEVRLG